MVILLLMMLVVSGGCNAEERYTEEGILSAVEEVGLALQCMTTIMQDTSRKQSESNSYLKELQAFPDTTQKKFENLERKLDALQEESPCCKNVKELQKTNETLQKQLLEKDQKVAEVEGRIQKLQEGEADLKEINYALRKTVEDLEKKQEDTLCKLPRGNEIIRQVREYNAKKQWALLWNSLRDLLERDTPAYTQLMSLTSNVDYPTYRMAYNGYKQLLELLVNCGGGVEMIDPYGDTFLHGAAQSGNVELAKWLIERGAYKEARSYYGYTPLIYAAMGNQLQMVQYFVQAQANTKAKGDNGYTALDWARSRSYSSVVQYLTQFPH